MTIVYQTDAEGVYVGLVEADRNPLELDRLLIPRGAIADPPPEHGRDERVRWIGSGWTVEPVPKPEPRTPPPRGSTPIRCHAPT